MDSSSTLVNKLQAMSCEKQFKCIADMYSNGFLGDNTISSMIDNGICIEHLAHLSLKTEQLLKLFEKNRQVCVEAAFTVIDRALTPQIQPIDFIDLFCRCCNESVCEYLYNIILFKRPIEKILKDKYISAIRYISSCENINCNTKSKALELEIYLHLIDTPDISYIRKCFLDNNYIYCLALSQNCYTPDDILNKLILMKNIKYSKQIRTNANLTLQLHRKSK